MQSIQQKGYGFCRNPFVVSGHHVGAGPGAVNPPETSTMYSKIQFRGWYVKADVQGAIMANRIRMGADSFLTTPGKDGI
jgi:hypothetical protein